LGVTSWCSIKTACRSADSIGANRIVGLRTASAIASAAAASFWLLPHTALRIAAASDGDHAQARRFLVLNSGPWQASIPTNAAYAVNLKDVLGQIQLDQCHLH
jgi:hypothetical protein